MALFTLNFLIMDDKGRTAADRHTYPTPDRVGDVMWKNVLDNKWYGPDPVIRRSRGAVCVFPQGQEAPHWVPSRLTRVVEAQENDSAIRQDIDAVDPVEDDTESSGAEMGDSVSLPQADSCQA